MSDKNITSLSIVISILALIITMYLFFIDFGLLDIKAIIYSIVTSIVFGLSFKLLYPIINKKK
ncbi:hypothetical protein COE50_27535 [Bacillus anthracis]|nr:hypothetical protein COE50_27535 [Bacillus anthracis]